MSRTPKLTDKILTLTLEEIFKDQGFDSRDIVMQDFISQCQPYASNWIVNASGTLSFSPQYPGAHMSLKKFLLGTQIKDLSKARFNGLLELKRILEREILKNSSIVISTCKASGIVKLREFRF